VRARGIDPGTAAIGWCDIERESAGVYRWIAHGVIEPKEIVRGGKMPIDDYGIDVFAVETPEEMHANDVIAAIRSSYEEKTVRGGRHGSPFTTGFHVGAARIVKTVKGLIETRALAERIACGIASGGGRIVEPTAAECRRALGVKFGAQRGTGPRLTPDQQIGHIIPLAVRGWPKRSNPHHRDAAAAALWALGGAAVEAAVKTALRGASSPSSDDGARSFAVPPPGTYGPGDYGPDSFGGSDCE
jgi:hypothetical protein